MPSHLPDAVCLLCLVLWQKHRDHNTKVVSCSLQFFIMSAVLEMNHHIVMFHLLPARANKEWGSLVVDLDTIACSSCYLVECCWLLAFSSFNWLFFLLMDTHDNHGRCLIIWSWHFHVSENKIQCAFYFVQHCVPIFSVISYQIMT